MKRLPEKQLTKDDATTEDDDVSTNADLNRGFDKAPPDVLAKRRIVKARRTLSRPTPTAESTGTAADAVAPTPNGSSGAADNTQPGDVKDNPFAALAAPKPSTTDNASNTTAQTANPFAALAKPNPSPKENDNVPAKTNDGDSENGDGKDKPKGTADETPAAEASGDGKNDGAKPEETAEKEKAGSSEPAEALSESDPKASATPNRTAPDADAAGDEASKKAADTESAAASDSKPSDSTEKEKEESSLPSTFGTPKKDGPSATNGSENDSKPLFGGAKPLFGGAKPLFGGAKPLFGNGKPLFGGSSFGTTDAAKGGMTFASAAAGTTGDVAKFTFSGASSNPFGKDAGNATSGTGTGASSSGGGGTGGGEEGGGAGAEGGSGTGTETFKEVENVETGEEGEDETFSARAKLYVLEKAEDGAGKWRERGVGKLKMKRDRTTGAGRLLMRTEATLRVVLNTPVFPALEMDKATERSLRFQGFDDASVSGAGTEGGNKSKDENEKGEDAKEEKKEKESENEKGPDGRRPNCFLVRLATSEVAGQLVDAVEEWKRMDSERENAKTGAATDEKKSDEVDDKAESNGDEDKTGGE